MRINFHVPFRVAATQRSLGVRLKKLKSACELTWETIASESHVSRRWRRSDRNSNLEADCDSARSVRLTMEFHL